MKLDFKRDFTGFDGQPLGGTLNSILGNVISAEKGIAEPLKFYGWSEKLFKGEVLDLDDHDTETLRNYILNHKTMENFIIGKLNEVFKTS